MVVLINAGVLLLQVYGGQRVFLSGLSQISHTEKCVVAVFLFLYSTIVLINHTRFFPLPHKCL